MGTLNGDQFQVGGGRCHWSDAGRPLPRKLQSCVYELVPVALQPLTSLWSFLLPSISVPPSKCSLSAVRFPERCSSVAGNLSQVQWSSVTDLHSCVTRQSVFVACSAPSTSTLSLDFWRYTIVLLRVSPLLSSVLSPCLTFFRLSLPHVACVRLRPLPVASYVFRSLL